MPRSSETIVFILGINGFLLLAPRLVPVVYRVSESLGAIGGEKKLAHFSVKMERRPDLFTEPRAQNLATSLSRRDGRARGEWFR